MAAVLLVMRERAMRKFASKNDLWDWGIILALVAGGAIILWASVWLVHSRAGAQQGEATRAEVSAVAARQPAAISRNGS
jgi:hypothetical protein